MDGMTFKKGVYNAFTHKKFKRQGNILWALGVDAVVLLGLQKGFGEQWFVNIGLCLNRLASDIPKRIENSHMYFRLERLFPQYRTTILTAGELDEPGQHEAYQDFLGLINSDIADALKNFASEKAIVEANQKMDFSSLGLVTKAARDLISNTL